MITLSLKPVSVTSQRVDVLKGHGFKACPEHGRRVPQTPQKNGRALQAAEKLNRAVGRGFIPGIKPIESMWALAPKVCFSGLSPEIRPLSAASLAPEGKPFTVYTISKSALNLRFPNHLNSCLATFTYSS